MEKDNANVPEGFCCPITRAVMQEPVFVSSGHSFEKVAIEAWFENHDTNPLTNEILSNKTLTPNYILKKLIEDYHKAEENPDREQQGHKR